MNDRIAPQAATELFAESYRLSPKQREVLDVLQTFPAGARAIEVANALEMHVNTARGHLEELVAQDAVRVITAPAKGRGRPSLIFQTRVPDNRAVAQEYITLIELMATMLGDPDADAMEDPAMREKAMAVGTQWANIMGVQSGEWSNLGDALAPLLLRLRQMGFDPTAVKAGGAAPQAPSVGSASASASRSEHTGQPVDDVSIALHSCPFIVNHTRPSSFVCAIHEGFIQESLGGAGKISLELKPFNLPGTCKVHVSNT